MRAAFPTYIEVESSETARSGLPEPWNERQVNRETIVPKALRASAEGVSYTAQKKFFAGFWGGQEQCLAACRRPQSDTEIGLEGIGDSHQL